MIGRLHEHDVRRRLPRRRPAGGDVRHRAGDGPLRRRDRDGPGGGPAQELHPARPVPVRQPVRARARPAAGPRSTSTRATTSRPSTRPSRWPTTTTSTPRRPRRSPAASSSAMGLSHLHRGLRRRAVEVDRRGRRGLGRRDVGIGQHPGPPHRQDRRHRRHPAPGPGPRDDVRPGRRERAGRADGRHRRPALGHAGHAVRLRLVRQPDAARSA